MTPRDERRIEITGHKEEGAGIYSVRDTGVGFFNPKYIHKLFGASSVCINRRSLKETALASPSSSRIIHRHGGRAWAEGS